MIQGAVAKRMSWLWPRPYIHVWESIGSDTLNDFFIPKLKVGLRIVTYDGNFVAKITCVDGALVEIYIQRRSWFLRFWCHILFWLRNLKWRVTGIIIRSKRNKRRYMLLVRRVWFVLSAFCISVTVVTNTPMPWSLFIFTLSGLLNPWMKN